MRAAGVYTVETAMVMSIIIVMIFSVLTFTLRLYGKVEKYSIKCADECVKYGVTSDTMRLERLLSGVKDLDLKGEE